MWGLMLSTHQVACFFGHYALAASVPSVPVCTWLQTGVKARQYSNETDCRSLEAAEATVPLSVRGQRLSVVDLKKVGRLTHPAL